MEKHSVRLRDKASPQYKGFSVRAQLDVESNAIKVQLLSGVTYRNKGVPGTKTRHANSRLLLSPVWKLLLKSLYFYTSVQIWKVFFIRNYLFL